MRDPASYIGKPVTSLQTMLRIVSVQESGLPRVIPDGIYGAQTCSAVKCFQQRRGLPPTGITNHQTWCAIVEAFEASRVEAQPAEPLNISLSQNHPLSSGSRNPHVLLVQAMLHTLCRSFDNLCDCGLSGVFDEDTEAAVMALQRTAGVQQTGVCDKQFWRLLVGLYEQITGL